MIRFTFHRMDGESFDNHDTVTRDAAILYAVEESRRWGVPVVVRKNDGPERTWVGYAKDRVWRKVNTCADCKGTGKVFFPPPADPASHQRCNGAGWKEANP